MNDGKDTRFDKIKKDYAAFMFAYVAQALWCFIGQLPIMISNSLEEEEQVRSPWRSPSEQIGRLLFLIGLVFETVSDAQKSAFRAKIENHNEFIQSGLWAYSRHPNHFGEIVLWFGITLSCSELFKSWSNHVAWLSPAFTYLLLTRVSGIPMLEAANAQKFGKRADFQKYIKETPVLFPRLFFG